nr:MAG TPA: hypothetical protein [Caudoviricetes sp.]
MRDTHNHTHFFQGLPRTSANENGQKSSISSGLSK